MPDEVPQEAGASVSGVWLFHLECGEDYVYEFTVHVDGHVAGQARPANGAAWTTTLKGSLQGEQLSWTEFSFESGSKAVGEFSSTIAKGSQALSGVGRATGGAVDLRFHGTKASTGTTILATAKSPRARAKVSSSCAWRSRQPGWHGASVMNSLAEDQARYWNDESYRDFYNTSSQERHAITACTAGAGLAPLAAARLQDAFRRNGDPAPPRSPRHKAALLVGSAASDDDLKDFGGRPGVLCERKAAHFQQVFAEISSGKCTILASQAPALLRGLHVPQPKAAVDRLLPEVLAVKASAAEASAGAIVPAAAVRGKAAEMLSYSDALQLYKQVLLPDLAKATVSDAVKEALAGPVATTVVQESLDCSPQPATAASPPASAPSSSDRGAVPYVGGRAALPRNFASSPKARLNAFARDEKYAALYRLPPKSSPRTATLFKKVGKYTIRPSEA